MERLDMVLKDRHAIALKKRSVALPRDPVFCFITVSSVLVLVHIYLLIRLIEMVPAVYRVPHEFHLHRSTQLNFPPPIQPIILKHDTLQMDPCYYPCTSNDFLGKNKYQNKSHE